mgnify:CR=1 FL=1
MGLLSDVVEVGSQQLNTLNVVALVELLVDGMGTVGGATHGQQQDVLAGSLLEGQGDGDTRDEGSVKCDKGVYGVIHTCHPHE